MKLSSRATAAVKNREHVGWASLNDYADKESNEGERAVIEAHVASCAQCQQELDAVREVTMLARAERDEVRAPDSLWPMVAALTIHSRSIGRHFLNATRWPLLAGALALLLLGFGVATWAATGCAGQRQLANPAKCSGPWYRVLRDGFQIRAKEIRKGDAGRMQELRRQAQHLF